MKIYFPRESFTLKYTPNKKNSQNKLYNLELFFKAQSLVWSDFNVQIMHGAFNEAGMCIKNFDSNSCLKIQYFSRSIIII